MTKHKTGLTAVYSVVNQQWFLMWGSREILSKWATRDEVLAEIERLEAGSTEPDPEPEPPEDVRIAGSRRACRQIVEAEAEAAAESEAFDLPDLSAMTNERFNAFMRAVAKARIGGSS